MAEFLIYYTGNAINYYKHLSLIYPIPFPIEC